MLLLKSLSLIQFKNYSNFVLQCHEKVIAFSGKNGIGKTNLLDAIYFLCFTKSYFAKSDVMVTQHGTNGCRIEGIFEKNDETLQVTSVLRETAKKEFLVNQEAYNRFSDHIGKLPCVMIAPDDVEIITGGSEERRKFIDTLLSQIDHNYLLQLIQYNKILAHRNSILKQFAITKKTDMALLDVLDEQLIPHTNYIFEKRKSFLQTFIPTVQQFYKNISGEKYTIDINYESQLQQQPFSNCLQQLREKDILLQRTNAGTHKDDIEITLTNKPFKQIASQGQRKSLLFALKFAEFETLQKAMGFAPILLLDDVFEKLDENRMQNLLQWVCLQNNGQVFLTDTHSERLEQTLKKLQVSYQLLALT